MRRIRHLEQCDYIIPIGQKLGQLVALSGQSNCVLERTWDQGSKADYSLEVHVKFNSDDIDGINLEARLLNNGEVRSCKNNTVSVYRIADGSFTRTFIGNFTPTLNGQVYNLDLTQVDFGSANELTSAETYLFEVTAQRQRREFRRSVYFNHLGCFDSILRLRKAVAFLNITKVDE